MRIRWTYNKNNYFTSENFISTTNTVFCFTIKNNFLLYSSYDEEYVLAEHPCNFMAMIISILKREKLYEL